MKDIIVVVGPTATGKTALSVSLAKALCGEVISCDSMQLYRDMSIGTAKPAPSEMCGIKHHLIDILDLNTPYSVSDYVKDAERCVSDIHSRGKKAIFCGGTGLYIDSFLSGIKFGEYDNNDEIHSKIVEQAEKDGAEELYKRLRFIDPDIAEKISPNNVKRVIRAIEVYETTGVTMSEWNKRSLENAVKKDAVIIGLDFESRDLLYSRIDKRVDIMLEDGLIDEVEKLACNGLRTSATAGQAIGYKEFYPYLDGAQTLEECTEALKRNSRRYAKRQLTWFRRNKDVNWIMRDNLDEKELFEKAMEIITERS